MTEKTKQNKTSPQRLGASITNGDTVRWYNGTESVFNQTLRLSTSLQIVLSLEILDMFGHIEISHRVWSQVSLT